MVKTNSGFPNGNWKCQHIHMQQSKSITVVRWWPNLVNVVKWRSNLVSVIRWWLDSFATQLWQPKTFRSPHNCDDRKRFDYHNVFPLPPPLVFSAFSFPPSLWWLKSSRSPSCLIFSQKNGVINGNQLRTWMEHVQNKWKNGKQSFLIRDKNWSNFVTHIFS